MGDQNGQGQGDQQFQKLRNKVDRTHRRLRNLIPTMRAVNPRMLGHPVAMELRKGESTGSLTSLGTLSRTGGSVINVWDDDLRDLAATAVDHGWEDVRIALLFYASNYRTLAAVDFAPGRICVL